MSENYHTPEKEAQHEFYLRIGENLRLRRTKLNLTQEDLAWLTNVSRVSINNIEAGKQRAPLHFLVTLCKALDTEIFEYIPDYSFGLKTIDELRNYKAKASFKKICSHEGMEHIKATNGDEYYICHTCNYSQKI